MLVHYNSNIWVQVSQFMYFYLVYSSSLCCSSCSLFSVGCIGESPYSFIAAGFTITKLGCALCRISIMKSLLSISIFVTLHPRVRQWLRIANRVVDVELVLDDWSIDVIAISMPIVQGWGYDWFIIFLYLGSGCGGRVIWWWRGVGLVGLLDGLILTFVGLV